MRSNDRKTKYKRTPKPSRPDLVGTKPKATGYTGKMYNQYDDYDDVICRNEHYANSWFKHKAVMDHETGKITIAKNENGAFEWHVATAIRAEGLKVFEGFFAPFDPTDSITNGGSCLEGPLGSKYSKGFIGWDNKYYAAWELEKLVANYIRDNGDPPESVHVNFSKPQRTASLVAQFHRKYDE